MKINRFISQLKKLLSENGLNLIRDNYCLQRGEVCYLINENSSLTLNCTDEDYRILEPLLHELKPIYEEKFEIDFLGCNPSGHRIIVKF